MRLSPFQPVVHPRGGQYCHVIDASHKAPQAALVDLPDGQLNPGQFTQNINISLADHPMNDFLAQYLKQFVIFCQAKRFTIFSVSSLLN